HQNPGPFDQLSRAKRRRKAGDVGNDVASIIGGGKAGRIAFADKSQIFLGARSAAAHIDCAGAATQMGRIEQTRYGIRDESRVADKVVSVRKSQLQRFDHRVMTLLEAHAMKLRLERLQYPQG